MEMIKVTFPDGSVHEFEKGVKILDVAISISEGFARNVIGAVVNGVIKGLSETLKEDCAIKFVKFEDKEGKEIFWHTSSHVMALAIQRLFPDTKFGIGPAIDNGFYYDLDSEHKFTPEDLEKIEKEMMKIFKEGYSVDRKEVDRDFALKYFAEKGQDYKIDLNTKMKAFYGMERQENDTNTPKNLVRDIIVCPICNEKLEYDYIQLNHHRKM